MYVHFEDTLMCISQFNSLIHIRREERLAMFKWIICLIGGDYEFFVHVLMFCKEPETNGDVLYGIHQRIEGS
jgi:hypothetical protein